MRVLITGASGFIGAALATQLVARGDQVYALVHKQRSFVKGVISLSRLDECTEVDAVVNLAGTAIADKRWSESRKKLLLESRIDTTQAVLNWIEGLENKPRVLVSGSAVGFYGAATKNTPVNEASEPLLHDFASKLCRKWEGAALEAEKAGVRVVLLRTGIVLGAGGALAKMKLPFSLGLGGPIASGEQWMSWIHLDDEVRAIIYLIDNETLSGPFNLTAPTPVRNREFVIQLGKALGRPAFIPMPALAIRAILGSEASTLLTEGLAVKPDRLMKSGFEFRYPSIDKAMKSAVSAF